MTFDTSINKTVAREVGAAVEEALKEVAEKFGLSVEVRGGSYDANSFRPKVEFLTKNAAEDEFRTYADMYGLDPDWFGAEFKAGGKTFKISGISTRSPKRPIICTEVGTDRRYKFTVDGIKASFVKAAI